MKVALFNFYRIHSTAADNNFYEFRKGEALSPWKRNVRKRYFLF